WKQIPSEDLKKIIDKKLLNLIGYRIPNQGMSSNDSLEIVGILPESYGDVIIPYMDITTKTGSDFDIDKMYVIAPNARPVFEDKVRQRIINNIKNLYTADTLVETLLNEGYGLDDIRAMTGYSDKEA